jgi:hypothetical protein
MLRAAGFVEVDCFYKRLHHAVIGVFKPRARHFERPFAGFGHHGRTY